VREAAVEKANRSPRQVVYAKPMDDGSKFRIGRNCVTVGGMIEMVTAILAALSICLFSAHAYDAYRTNSTVGQRRRRIRTAA
jgi:hypothetical protein